MVLGRIPEAVSLVVVVLVLFLFFFNYRIHLWRRTLLDRSKEKVFCGKASV